jgi:hypothetical protein
MEALNDDSLSESFKESPKLDTLSSIEDETISKNVDENDSKEFSELADIKNHKNVLTKIHKIAIRRKGEEQQFQIKIPQNVESIEGIYVTVQLVNPNDITL